MIAPSVVQQVRRLLAEGRLSQRRIAKTTGVSRGTVAAIATGKRREQGPRKGRDETETLEPSGPPRRCPGCGATVYMPCRACRTREIGDRRARSPWGLLRPEKEPLGLDLRDEHRRRYEQVRREAAATRPAGFMPVEEHDPGSAETDDWDEWEEPRGNPADPWDDWADPPGDEVTALEDEERLLADWMEGRRHE